jgi:hypothetical protein
MTRSASPSKENGDGWVVALSVDELRIRPARRSLAGVLGKFAKFSPDFMAERDAL